MALLEQLNKDMVVSMKNKDSFSLGVIRMAKGAIQLEAINKKKELTDEDIVSVISKQIKMRNDSIAEFTKAGRTESKRNRNIKQIYARTIIFRRSK